MSMELDSSEDDRQRNIEMVEFLKKQLLYW